MRHLLMAAVAAAATASPAAAVQTLDQSYLPGPLYGGSTTTAGDATFRRVQTFTAGVTGTLTRIDVLAALGTLTTLNLLSTANGVPTTTVLATGSYTGTTADGYASFTLSFDQTAGAVYGFEPIATAPGGAIYNNPTGTYAGGSDYFLNTKAGIGSFTANAADNYFRTFVGTDVAALPEPGAWLLMIVGLGAAGVGLRRGRDPAKPWGAVGRVG